MFLREFYNLKEKQGCNMTEQGRDCPEHGSAECPGYKLAETSARDKLYQRHQELRKKSGLPDPDYYKELKATFDLPDAERFAKVAELKKKYKVSEDDDSDRTVRLPPQMTGRDPTKPSIDIPGTSYTVSMRGDDATTQQDARHLGRLVASVPNPLTKAAGMAMKYVGQYDQLPTGKKVARAMDSAGSPSLDRMIPKLMKEQDIEEGLRDGEYYLYKVTFDDGTTGDIKVASDEFDFKTYYAKKGKNVVDVERQGGIRSDFDETSDYFRRREREEAIISGKKSARKKSPAQTSDYARRKEQEKKQGVAEAGPFTYGAKKPRKGSVADLAAKKRKEQERDKQPVEPKDHMVGVARVRKDLAEGVMDQIKNIYMMLVSNTPMGTPESEFLGQWQRIIQDELGKNIDIDTLARLRANFVNRYKSMSRRGDVGDWHREMGHDLEEGVAEGRKPGYNFDIEDIKKLEQVRDIETLKTLALQLISKPSTKPMKPEKVEWFKSALERMDSPLKVIKLMYDLLLSGEGHSVIGSRKSMNPNTYRQRFGEDQVTNEDVEQYLEEIQRAGYEVITETVQLCPECGGPAFEDQMLAEKKDACYSKVKSRYKVWPSAYASGALVRCRKVGAANWGNKSKK